MIEFGVLDITEDVRLCLWKLMDFLVKIWNSSHVISSLVILKLTSYNVSIQK